MSSYTILYDEDTMIFITNLPIRNYHDKENHDFNNNYTFRVIEIEKLLSKKLMRYC